MPKSTRLFFITVPFFSLFLLVGAPVTHAADSDLDTSFSNDGITTLDIGTFDECNSVALQADGKIVVVGKATAGANTDFTVIRFNADGTLDTTFDIDGYQMTDFAAGDDYGLSVAIQDDGKIVVTGMVFNGADRDIGLARYNEDGSLDTTFDTNGFLITDIGGNHNFAWAVAIQDNGRIVVAGVAVGTQNDIAVARYLSNGSLDTSFDSDGYVLTDIMAGDDRAYSVAIQDDGKIVVAGRAYNGADYDFVVARYNSNGSLDTTFASNGYVTTDISGNDDKVFSVTIQDNGKIVVAGRTDNGSDFDVAVARYLSNGSLDTDFDSDGYVQTDIAGLNNEGHSVAIQNDGKILVAGFGYNGSSSDFSLIRYNSDGSLDTNFTSDGYLLTDIDLHDQGWGLVIQGDGKYVLVGDSHDSASTGDFAVARYIGDETPPTVSATTPTDGAANQALDTAITAEFNESLDDATITNASLTLADNKRAPISGAVTYDDATRTATFTPDSELETFTAYTATLSTDITDKAGNALADEYTWSFTTGTTTPSVSGSSGGGCALDAGPDGTLWLLLLLPAGIVFLRRRVRHI